MLSPASYHILVAGAMNPRIHHPSWYQLVEIISKQEAEESLASSGTFGIPGAAQVHIPSVPLTINCQEQRWEIQTDIKTNLDRLQNITWRVFDECLVHTPVNKFGLTFVYQCLTRCPEVPAFLADRAVSMGIGLTDEAASDADVALLRTFDDHVSLVRVQKSPNGKNCVSLSYHYEYPVGTAGGGFFRLEEKIADRIGDALRDSEEQTGLIVGTISEKVGI